MPSAYQIVTRLLVDDPDTADWTEPDWEAYYLLIELIARCIDDSAYVYRHTITQTAALLGVITNDELADFEEENEHV